MTRRLAPSLALTLALCGLAHAQAPAPSDFVVDVGENYHVYAGLTYLRANNQDLKLDVYVPWAVKEPNPTVIAFHGGGWVAGSKDGLVLHLLPYIEMGFTVVNVQYRLASTSPAPAAVEDCRCALRWVAANAEKYRFDLSRLVTTGASAGGHLALTTALLPVAAGFDRPCPLPDAVRWVSGEIPEVRVAAAVNWFGITDVADVVAGPNSKGWAVEWLGSREDRLDLARRLSPLTYVRPGGPAVLSIHGDKDALVPYAHAQRLHAALEQAGARHKLLTVAGGGHGDFSLAERRRAFAEVRAFLADLRPKR